MNISAPNFIIAGVWTLIAIPASLLSVVFGRKRCDSNLARGMYRLDFLSWIAWSIAGTVIIQGALTALPSSSIAHPASVQPLLTFAGATVGLVLLRKRLNNLGYSGWWILPLLGWCLAVELVIVFFKSGNTAFDRQLAELSALIGCVPLVVFWMFLLFAPANFRSTRRIDHALVVGAASTVLWLSAILFSAGRNERLELRAANPLGSVATIVQVAVALFQSRQQTIPVEPPSDLPSTMTEEQRTVELQRRARIAMDDVRSVAGWPRINVYGEVSVPFPSALRPTSSGLEQIPLEIQRDVYSQYQTWTGAWQDLEIVVRRITFRSGLNPAAKISLAGLLESWRKTEGSQGFATYGLVPLVRFDPTAVYAMSRAVTKQNQRCKMAVICWNSGDVKWIVMAISHRQNEDARVGAIINSLRKNYDVVPLPSVAPAPENPVKRGGVTSFETEKS